jgi:hypothetical protein
VREPRLERPGIDPVAIRHCAAPRRAVVGDGDDAETRSLWPVRCLVALVTE